MRHLNTIACVSLILVFSPYVRGADELADAERASVVEFASRWFLLVATGDYSEALKAGTSDFQKNHLLKDWTEKDQKFASLAGALTKQKFILNSWQFDPPQVAPGRYFQIYAYAKFEKIDRFRMEIRLRQDKDGSLHLLSYQRKYIDRDTEQRLRVLQRKFDGTRFQTEKILRDEMEQYYTEILALSGWQGFSKQDTIVIREAETDTGYIFTTPSHPAHPAVIKLRETVYAGTKGTMKSGHFAGDEAAYQKWLESVVPRKE